MGLSDSLPESTNSQDGRSSGKKHLQTFLLCYWVETPSEHVHFLKAVLCSMKTTEMTTAILRISATF